MPDNQGRSEGENTGVGSTYTAVLVEKVNKSNPRNQGPTGNTSAVGQVPQTTETSRNTGKV